MSRHPTWRRIVVAGLVAAFVDTLFAFGLQRYYAGHFAPAQIFRGIASGVLHDRAFEAGVAPVLLGVALHATFATAWAALFGLLYRWREGLRRFVRSTGGAVATAFAYGAVVWLVMNFVTKPLGGIEPDAATTRFFYVMLIGHGIFVGLPIVLLIRSRAD